MVVSTMEGGIRAGIVCLMTLRQLRVSRYFFPPETPERAPCPLHCDRAQGHSEDVVFEGRPGGLRKNSRRSRVTWKSANSGPRKSSQMNEGFPRW
jgi:hypothetical protein